jgi:PAS domain S-box-containing protein
MISDLSSKFNKAYIPPAVITVLLIVAFVLVIDASKRYHQAYANVFKSVNSVHQLCYSIFDAVLQNDKDRVFNTIKRLEREDDILVSDTLLTPLHSTIELSFNNRYAKGVDSRVSNYLNFARNCTMFEKVSCAPVPEQFSDLHHILLKLKHDYRNDFMLINDNLINLLYILVGLLFVTVLYAIFLLYLPMRRNLKKFIKEVENSAKFQNIINDASSNAIIAIDRHHRILIFNKGAQKIFGYPKHEMIGYNKLDKIVPKDYLPEHMKGLKSFFETNQFKHSNQSMEIRAKRASGETFPIKITYHSNEDVNNPIVVANIQDISEEKQQEQKLMSQSRSAAMGEMIGNIAHQWRQPLNSISTLATGAKMRKKNDLISHDEIIDTYTKIKEYTDFLSQTIDDFKNFFKKEKSVSIFPLQSIIAKARKLVDASFKDNSIRLFLSMPKEPVLVKGLPNELSQVLINLLNNSKDALADKEKKVVLIKLKKSGDEIELSVSDNGGGVPDHIIEKIFDPYVTTKHKSQGTGIGLYMSRNIVQNMRGTLNVRNEKFKIKGDIYYGATFMINLPELEGDNDDFVQNQKIVDLIEKNS